MDISQLLNMLNLNQSSKNQQQNNTVNIPIEVLNSYPRDFVDRPINSQKVNSQVIQTQSQPNTTQNNQSFQNPLSLLSNLLPTLMKGSLDINGLLNSLMGGGKANILSNLINPKTTKAKKTQQKNSPNYDELKKIDDYEFED
jgi:hypothetical protein